MVELAKQYGLLLHAHSDADAVERLFKQWPQARILWAHSGFDRPVSIHELEVQAEVDKYAITLFLLGAQQAGRFPQRLHHWLFERARVDSALTRQKRELYASANRYAARFCRVLEDRFLQRRRVRCEALVRALRHFYRLTHAPKIRLIEIGHAH